jgi:Heterokaryon incompatibility protein (HET)
MSHRVHVGSSQQIPITLSLRNALRSLRFTSRPRTIWADAICIDQENPTERNQQVALMGKIYRRASAVTTYIGEETNNIRDGLILAKTISDYAVAHIQGRPDERLLSGDDDDMDALGFPRANNPFWEALRSLLWRTWSTRAWMIQESVLNKNTKMACGRLDIPWNLVPDLARYSAEQRIPILALCSDDEWEYSSSLKSDALAKLVPFSNAYVLHELRKAALDSGAGKTLLELLESCHRFQCSDPRDKVYSLLGLARDSHKLEIVPDYKAPVEKVYLDTAVRIL